MQKTKDPYKCFVSFVEAWIGKWIMTSQLLEHLKQRNVLIPENDILRFENLKQYFTQIMLRKWHLQGQDELFGLKTIKKDANNNRKYEDILKDRHRSHVIDSYV